MGSIERRERQKENLRREILDAAREMFIDEGYEAVSMRKIANRIEYSPTTIYLYFKDKSELFNQLCEETFAQLAQRLENLHRKHSDPLDYLRAGLRCYIDFGLKNPRTARARSARCARRSPLASKRASSARWMWTRRRKASGRRSTASRRS